MNSKSINRNVWALTLSLGLGVIGYCTFSAQAAAPSGNVYHVGERGLYVIVCADRSAYTFYGSANGAI